MAARIIVVSGAPGAGKTTVSGCLARRFERAAHIEADALQRLVVSGSEWPDTDAVVVGEAANQLRLRGVHACLLARSFAAAGFVAVVDDIVVGDRRDEYAEHLTGSDWCLILLDPTLEVLRLRNMGRPVNAFGQARALHDVVRATPGVHIDNGALSVAATVERILEVIAREP